MILASLSPLIEHVVDLLEQSIGRSKGLQPLKNVSGESSAEENAESSAFDFEKHSIDSSFSKPIDRSFRILEQIIQGRNCFMLSQGVFSNSLIGGKNKRTAFFSTRNR